MNIGLLSLVAFSLFLTNPFRLNKAGGAVFPKDFLCRNNWCWKRRAVHGFILFFPAQLEKRNWEKQDNGNKRRAAIVPRTRLHGSYYGPSPPLILVFLHLVPSSSYIDLVLTS